MMQKQSWCVIKLSSACTALSAQNKGTLVSEVACHKYLKVLKTVLCFLLRWLVGKIASYCVKQTMHAVCARRPESLPFYLSLCTLVSHSFNFSL